VNERNPHSGSAFQAIRAIDYTVIFVRDMAAMRRFYKDIKDILGFPLLRELSPGWIEYRVGDNTLALARPRLTAADVPTPNGSASLQLAFKVSEWPSKFLRRRQLGGCIFAEQRAWTAARGDGTRH
jgi:catechol 2,3-dioxygenase-like lactoylglutathione lyase family enzyme